MHEGHRERLRARFLRDDGAAMEDHELVELLLYYVYPREDTNPLAHELVHRFGGVEGLLQAKFTALTQYTEVSERGAVLLRLVSQLARRWAQRAGQEVYVHTVEDAGRYLQPYFSGRTEELFYMLCTDLRGRVLGCLPLNEGTTTHTTLDVRLVVGQALNLGASIIVMAHNHPSGVALPSSDDISATRHTRDVLRTVGVMLADHLVFADGDYVSMADSGYLKEPEKDEKKEKERK